MRLVDIIGTTSAISPRVGLKAYEYVSDYIRKESSITLSFSGITDCTSAFCNSFFGKLYMDFPPSKVDQFLQLTDMDTNDIWSKKMHNAKLLGTNENVRTLRKTNMDDLIFS